ncbi:GNAT family N-acetyltransferase [Oscillatoria sp. FACHB-1407]|uniref:GNAT family N-acetyltransferase n=1 Tax=Oscillatoria sp. FACHB-1407 TaxID=2692847 RepID=UPI002814D1BB|nr:GNAT family N-acetyltransferase [Oscillatoria sp. FACHB-1407]
MNSVCEDSPFLIRGARQQDLGSLAEVLTHSFHTRDGVLGLMYPLLRLGIYEDLRTRLRTQAPHYACIVAVKRSPLAESFTRVNNPVVASITEALAGTVEIGLRTQPPWHVRSQQYLYLSNLAVGKEFRRQGVAFQLLRACERIALDWGYRDLYLHVLENNQPARQLYLKAGYQIQREESGLGNWFLGQPKQLFLHKHLSGS